MHNVNIGQSSHPDDNPTVTITVHSNLSYPGKMGPKGVYKLDLPAT